MIRTLKDLLTEFGAEEFFRHFVEKSRWLKRAVEPSAAESLLPWAEIDRLITKVGLSPEQLRVVVNGNAADANMYLDPKSGRVRGDAFQDLTAQGATFVINGLSLLVPEIAELAANIERELSQAVNVNCYASFGEQSAFHAHADNHDVFIVQIAGAKHWRCYGVDVPFPVQGGTTPKKTEPIWDGVLNVGDVLYLPRGEVHAAVPVQRPCVHLTIGIVEKTGVDFLAWLGTAAEGEEKLRMNIARNAGEPQRTAREKELKQALHALIDATPLADYFADADRKRAPRSVSALNFAQRLAPDSELISALLRRIDLEIDDPDEVKLEIGGRHIRLSNLARRALYSATERERITLRALAAELHLRVDDDELAESLADLARKALIEIADTSAH